MIIQAGARNWSDFFYYLENGASEIYCALNGIPGHCYRGKDFETPSEILKAAKSAHEKGVRLYMVANEVQAGLFDITVSTVREMVKNGIDGVIIRDLSILEALKRKKIKTEFILSSLALCFNKETLKFYSDMGISRIAIPEQLLPSEARNIVKNNLGISTEIFLSAREYCVVLNGFCYLSDFTGKCICRDPFKSGHRNRFLPRPDSKEHFSRLYDFYSMGVNTLKIGRHPHGHYARLLFQEAKAILKLLESGIDKKNFIEKSLEIDSKIGLILNKGVKRK